MNATAPALVKITSNIVSQIQSRLTKHYKDNLYRSRLKFIKSQAIRQKNKLNFSSNDYLGFANNEYIIKKLQALLPIIGTGSGASNMISGYHTIHQDLELLVAGLVKCEQAILFPSGYMANLAIADVLLNIDNQNTIAIHDHNNHASLLDGSRLANCKYIRYKHNNLNHLQLLLQKYNNYQNNIIFTESLFSMDGDFAPLSEMSEISKINQLGLNNSVLVIDDSHAFGLYNSGRGLSTNIDINSTNTPKLVMGTFGKAIGSAGAFVAGPKIFIESLIQFARPYIYTTSLSPIAAAASLYAIQLNLQDSSYREQLFTNIQYFCEQIKSSNLNLNLKLDLSLINDQSPIQPIILGRNTDCIKITEYLAQNNIIVTAIRAPTVPANKARIRLTLSAKHTQEDLDYLIKILNNYEP
ncbi:MAG: aminotransferase class I/II-fold pyridoxal phosphate-dependent enzyme [Gammaproteobacteria bacterium]|nr:aminotransferase class I/II-fold pyridoxal phosphate-dependent enzyme [Gammaproteobacteria bacterium]